MYDSTLWETLKVVIHGNLISYTSAAKKEKEKWLSEINNALKKAYQVSQSPDDYRELLKLKYEYNDILSSQVNNLLLKLKLSSDGTIFSSQCSQGFSHRTTRQDRIGGSIVMFTQQYSS